MKKLKKMHMSAFLQKCQKPAGLQSQRVLKKSQVRSHGKMPITRRSVVIENDKNSQVCCQGKIPKTRRSAVTQNYKNPQACVHRKFPKLERPRSWQYANEFPGLQSQILQIMHRSAFIRKCQKLAGLRSRKNPKNLLVRGQRKMPKFTGPRSRTSVKSL